MLTIIFIIIVIQAFCILQNLWSVDTLTYNFELVWRKHKLWNLLLSVKYSLPCHWRFKFILFIINALYQHSLSFLCWFVHSVKYRLVLNSLQGNLSCMLFFSSLILSWSWKYNSVASSVVFFLMIIQLTRFCLYELRGGQTLICLMNDGASLHLFNFDSRISFFHPSISTHYYQFLDKKKKMLIVYWNSKIYWHNILRS